MTESLNKSNISNSFLVWREILKSITAFTTVFPKADFDKNLKYFEDEPNPKSREFPGYPVIFIDTNIDDDKIAIKNLKKINYDTRISIMTDYFAETSTPRINSYLSALINYLNANQSTLLTSYGIVIDNMSKFRDRDEIAEKQLVIAGLTVSYHTSFDVE